MIRPVLGCGVRATCERLCRSVDDPEDYVSIFSRLSNVSRRRKLSLLESRLPLSKLTRVLDVGGEVSDGGPDEIMFLDWCRHREALFALNLSFDAVRRISRQYPGVGTVVGDACRLPWPDKSFDLVYSNAVIEHLSTLEQQAQMAREIMRVGRNWFVTTPNRWFPFEFHMRLPLVTWLPTSTMRWIGGLWSFNHVLGRYQSGHDCGDLRLLSARELKRLFPGSRIIKQRVTIWPETLIAVGGESVV
ncbi:unnamed protein product [marine sediment metagenome]|uniref:Methyltransferase type 11 domain-containing protein n=1 Tax=marine sediment metagenome TaxID=412755 RepID=X0T877_9ZZZZ